MVVQALLLMIGALRNSVTFDEFQHLPAGISYWEQGTFFAYHHNPPVAKLMFSIPALLTRVSMDYSSFYYQSGDRHSDFLLAQGFAERNSGRFHPLFVVCRLVTVCWCILGGWVIFRWGTQMFNVSSALIAQFLWAFSPTTLAHGSLVTPDLQATVVGFLGTFLFWKYLQNPAVRRLLSASVVLGIAIGSKYTLLLLPGIWSLLAIIAVIGSVRRAEEKWTIRKMSLDVAVMTYVSLLTLNCIYTFEGSGTPLGRMEFVSKTFTEPVSALQSDGPRQSRFNGEMWRWIPIPLPEQFVLGLDHQMADLDNGSFENYLHGEFRNSSGWWYQYLYAAVVKTPFSTLLLIPFSVVGWCWDFRRQGLMNLASLIVPIVVPMWMLSRDSTLNIHSRYMNIVDPYLFLFISAGAMKVVSEFRWRQSLLTACIAMNAVTTSMVAPHHLSYFNEVVGGPRAGSKYLGDSNVDWGQGLVSLKDWIDERPDATEIQLAYFGAVPPELYGIQYQVPVAISQSNEPSQHRLKPGVHIVSVNYVAGSSFPPLGADGVRIAIPEHGYAFYQKLKPVDVIANCFHVYKVSESDIELVSGNPTSEDDAGESQ